MSSKSVYLFTLSDSLDQELELALASNSSEVFVSVVVSVMFVPVVLMAVVMLLVVFVSVMLVSMVLVTVMLMTVVMLLVVMNMMAMVVLVSGLVMVMTLHVAMMFLMVVSMMVLGVVVMTMVMFMMRMVSVVLHVVMVVVTLMMVSLVVVMMLSMVMLLVMVVMMMGHMVVVMVVKLSNSVMHSLLGSLDQDLCIFVLDFQSRNLDGFDLSVDLLDLRTTAAATVHLVDAGDGRSLSEELDLLLEFAGSLLLAFVVVELDHQHTAVVTVGMLDLAFQNVDFLLVLANQDGHLAGFLADFQTTGLQQLLLVLHQSVHDRSLLVAGG